GPRPRRGEGAPKREPLRGLDLGRRNIRGGKWKGADRGENRGRDAQASPHGTTLTESGPAVWYAPTASGTVSARGLADNGPVWFPRAAGRRASDDSGRRTRKREPSPRDQHHPRESSAGAGRERRAAPARRNRSRGGSQHGSAEP